MQVTKWINPKTKIVSSYGKPIYTQQIELVVRERIKGDEWIRKTRAELSKRNPKWKYCIKEDKKKGLSIWVKKTKVSS